jgi:hypothetical protein
MRMVFLAVLFLSLAGCAVMLRPFEPASIASSATLSIENRTSLTLFVAAYDESDGCRGRRVIPRPGPDSATTVRVPGGRPFSFSVTQLGSAGSSCSITVEFTPEIGGTYVAVSRQAEKGCAVQVFSVAASDAGREQWAQIPLKRKSWRAGLDETGSFCAANDLAKVSGSSPAGHR